MDNDMDENTVYKQFEEDQCKCIESILNSNSVKKIVVAGPGTGKTTLFEQICRKKDSKNLILSFINELVDDLKEKLSEIAEVKTLHSFANKCLQNENYYTKITEVIEKDFKVINGTKISFNEIFAEFMEEKKDELQFYSIRRKYYNYFGPQCSVYAVIKYFQSYPDKVPDYTQILVDEFQDFSKLEIKLIDIISSKNPVLIAGDDDQSIYSFRHAFPEEIRKRHKSKDYCPFELPFCFRSTNSIVNCVNAIITTATRQGLFSKSRINKTYKYFRSSKKDELSDRFKTIITKRPVYEGALAFQIDKKIKELYKNEKNKEISVLIISCFPSRKSIKKLHETLQKKGFKNIQPLKEKEYEISKIDGYKLLLKNKKCNLGWRILSEYFFNKDGLENAIKKSYENNLPFEALFSSTDKNNILGMLKIMKKIRDKENISNEEAKKIFNELNYDLIEIALEKVKTEIKEYSDSSDPYKKTLIKITTLPGCKGLTSDYVFLVGFDDRYILEKGKDITEESICKFLVAITRARKRLYIYGINKQQPIFMTWVEKKYLEEDN